MANLGKPAPLELIGEVEDLIGREGEKRAAELLGVRKPLLRSVLSGQPVMEHTCALLRERLGKVYVDGKKRS